MPTKQVVAQGSQTQPATEPTWQFLLHLIAQQPEKRWLRVIWDNASFHRSHELKRRIREYNRNAGKEGRTRIVPYPLPVRASRLNPIEPHWLQRAVYSVDHPLTPEQLRQRVGEYFDRKNATFISDS